MSAPLEAPRRADAGGVVGNIYAYEVFNAASWIVVLGSPMLLFFQRLHASATVLALAASLAPLLSTLQIPAAPYVEKIGYRRMVVNGWTTRALFILGMTVVAFLPDSVDATWRIVLMLLLMFAYNFSRGISICAIMPWFTHIVPESRRGEFLAKDQISSSLAVVVSLTIIAWVLGGHPAWYSFGVMYLFGAGRPFSACVFCAACPMCRWRNGWPIRNRCRGSRSSSIRLSSASCATTS